jgi:hypothetical protein
MGEDGETNLSDETSVKNLHGSGCADAMSPHVNGPAAAVLQSPVDSPISGPTGRRIVVKPCFGGRGHITVSSLVGVFRSPSLSATRPRRILGKISFSQPSAMKDPRFAHLPLAAVSAILIMVGMPLLARLQPKSQDDYWRRIRPETYLAGGRLLYEGQPVVDAIVVFHTSIEETGHSYSAVGSTDHEGHFWLRTFSDGYGVAAGRHQITVQKMVPTGRIVEGTGYEGGEDFPSFLGEEEMVNALPERFADPSTSGLFAMVTKEGPNEFVIRLTKEPPPEALAAIAERERAAAVVDADAGPSTDDPAISAER